ncbi:MAG: N-acetyltransferase, partial [Deltaproteobacteria bacterium]
IYENIRDFFVCEDEDGGVVGVAALHVMWEDLAEIRSLAVKEGSEGGGIGRMLMDACLSEARSLGIKRVFALTYRSGFFEKFGFREVEKSTLPQKIWTDCLKCSKFPDCDETAVILESGGSGESQ